MSRKHGGEKYVKSFDGYIHLQTMLYAVIYMILQCVRVNAAFRLNFQDYHIAEDNVVFLFNDMVSNLKSEAMTLK